MRERARRIEVGHIETEQGHSFGADTVIFCTGYEADLSFLDATIRATIVYDSSDRLLSHIAYDSVMHPELDNLYFVGMYRGPYFGVIELQARWAAMMLAGETARPTMASSARALDAEWGIRARQPRPQFPHGNYVEFADAIASRINVYPRADALPREGKVLSEGPVIPAHYRLCGPHAKPEIAAAQIRSACLRMGLEA